MGVPLTWDGFRTINCYSCGTGFAIETGLYNQRLNDHESFWCPNGHVQHFTGPSYDTQRIAELERQVAQERQKAESATRSREWAESQAKGANISAGKARAAAARLKHRVQCGVCPECHRTFKQLAAHMQSKHAQKVTKK